MLAIAARMERLPFRRRVRFVRQTSNVECAFACLAMVASYFGLPADLRTLRQLSPPSVRGTTLKNLIAMAKQVGISARPVSVELELLDRLALPAILHWDMSHFVVLERVGPRGLLVHDPRVGTRTLDWEEVSNSFTGVALECRLATPRPLGDVFLPVRVRDLWNGSFGLVSSLSHAVILSGLIQGALLVTPYLISVSLSGSLEKYDSATLDRLIALFLGLAAFVFVASLLRSQALRFTGSAISFHISSNIADRLFRLPIHWFEKRHSVDILAKFQTVAPIRAALTDTAITGIFDSLLVISSGLIMVIAFPRLGMISISALSLYLCFKAANASRTRLAHNGRVAAAAKEQAVLLESLRGVRIVRLHGGELARNLIWQETLIDSINAESRVAMLASLEQSVAMLIVALEAAISLWAAVHLMWEGHLSLGQLFAFNAYKSQFLLRGASMGDAIFGARLTSVYLDRLSDVLYEKEDPSFGEEPKNERPFHGALSLENISYAYHATDLPVLTDLSATFAAGAHIAITGPSGCGKSTLVKIILGLDYPTRGRVLVDNEEIESFGYDNYRKSVAGILQTDMIFDGTIAENIALFSDSIDYNEIAQAAESAAVSSFIEALPMQYDTLVGDMGSALSGGQVQRILLARALYRKPSLIVLDEATSHLDASLERDVSQAISKLGITRIVIAHRAETIAAAETVYCLRDGKLVLVP